MVDHSTSPDTSSTRKCGGLPKITSHLAPPYPDLITAQPTPSPTQAQHKSHGVQTVRRHRGQQRRGRRDAVRQRCVRPPGRLATGACSVRGRASHGPGTFWWGAGVPMVGRRRSRSRRTNNVVELRPSICLLLVRHERRVHRRRVCPSRKSKPSTCSSRAFSHPSPPPSPHTHIAGRMQCPPRLCRFPNPYRALDAQPSNKANRTLL